MEDIMKIDLYELLGVAYTVDNKAIKKAYRKKALSCHPDKNPDNPNAAELFQQLSKALEILTDGAARSSYDKILRARQAAEARNRELDSKRKKLKEDLDARERASKETEDAATKLQREIDRLRKEGSKQLEEEIELLRKRILEERQSFDASKYEMPKFQRLKAKWKAQKGDETNGGYTQTDLKSIFQKHGEITCVVISSKKRGSALIEFRTSEAAKSAFESEAGRPDNPLTLTWVGGEPPKPESKEDPQIFEMSKSPPPMPSEGSAITTRDYESIVLMKLRQAEERKKIIQKMMEDEGDQ